jgi:hypothetical protein
MNAHMVTHMVTHMEEFCLIANKKAAIANRSLDT